MRLAVQATLFLTMGSALVPAHGFAQDDPLRRILPHVRYFEAPIADPLEPRLGVGLLRTNLFRAAPEGRERSRPFFIPDPEDAADDVNAFTAVGGTLPWYHVAKWSDSTGIVMGVTAGVLGRFRIEYPTREDVGQDWFVGMPIEVAKGKWSGRFRFIHRSSHLGDEVVETTGASRIEVGGEYIDVMAAYKVVPNARVYGATSWIFRSYTEYTPVLMERGGHDRTLVQLGADAHAYPWVNGNLGLVAGVDWRRAQRTEWKDSFAAAAGLALKTPTRRATFLVRYFSGVSLLEQFFLTPEKYWSIELVTDF